jgi:AraC-like DNA-binding protein
MRKVPYFVLIRHWRLPKTVQTAARASEDRDDERSSQDWRRDRDSQRGEGVSGDLRRCGVEYGKSCCSEVHLAVRKPAERSQLQERGGMSTAAGNFTPVRFSSGDLSDRNQALVWWEAIGRKLFRADMQPLADGPFRGDAFHRALPDLGVFVGRISGRLTRTRELVADGNDHLWFAISSEGTEIVTQLGRELTLGEGDATLISYAELLTLVRSKPGRYLGLHIPVSILAPLVNNIGDALIRPIPRDTEALRLLIGYFSLLQEEHMFATSATRQLAAAHVHDLVALAIGARRDAEAVAQNRGARAARLHAIKADITKNLGRCDLSVGVMAQRHRLHPRYIQRLFEHDGTTYSEYVTHQRLTRAHQMLTNPLVRDRRIGAIALECGFSDPSYFDRCFRQLYGASPSDVRVTAQKSVG